MFPSLQPLDPRFQTPTLVQTLQLKYFKEWDAIFTKNAPSKTDFKELPKSRAARPRVAPVHRYEWWLLTVSFPLGERLVELLQSESVGGNE
jgi:hypothetical protein